MKKVNCNSGLVSYALELEEAIRKVEIEHG
jgi:hypothetical protein